MTKEELDAALAAIPKRGTEPAAVPAPVASVLSQALPSPEQYQRWRQQEERRVALEAERERRAQEARERSKAEGEERRRAAVAELSERCSPKLLKACRDNPSLSAVLLGPTGCGKSSAARLLGVLCPSEPGDRYWVTAADLSTASMKHGLGEGRAPEVERARNAVALVIDDVGNERDTSALFEVLDYRYSTGKPVIVTSGLTQAELKAHVGAAAVRRMVEQFAGHKVLIIDCHK